MKLTLSPMTHMPHAMNLDAESVEEETILYHIYNNAPAGSIWGWTPADEPYRIKRIGLGVKLPETLPSVPASNGQEVAVPNNQGVDHHE